MEQQINFLIAIPFKIIGERLQWSEQEVYNCFTRHLLLKDEVVERKKKQQGWEEKAETKKKKDKISKAMGLTAQSVT